MPLKVIIADDHLVFREGLRSLICQEPDLEVVAEAGDGKTAVRLAGELNPDLVLMDVNMPELNGIDATRQLVGPGRAHVLVLSMESDRSFVVEALQAGATGYLLKDCAFAELAKAIRLVAAGEPYLSPQIAHLVIKEFIRQRSEDEGARAAEKLTPRESRVLQMIADGRNTKEIAFAFNVSIKTIDSQRHSIMKKLGLYSIAELTKYALRTGVTSL